MGLFTSAIYLNSMPQLQVTMRFTTIDKRCARHLPRSYPARLPRGAAWMASARSWQTTCAKITLYVKEWAASDLLEPVHKPVARCLLRVVEHCTHEKYRERPGMASVANAILVRSADPLPPAVKSAPEPAAPRRASAAPRHVSALPAAAKSPPVPAAPPSRTSLAPLGTSESLTVHLGSQL